MEEMQKLLEKLKFSKAYFDEGKLLQSNVTKRELALSFILK